MAFTLAPSNYDYTVTASGYDLVYLDNNSSVDWEIPSEGDKLEAIIKQARNAYELTKDNASYAAAHTYKLWTEINGCKYANEHFQKLVDELNDEISDYNKANRDKINFERKLLVKARPRSSQFNVVVKYTLNFIYARQASNVSRYVHALEWLHQRFDGMLVQDINALVSAITDAGGFEAVILKQRGTKASNAKATKSAMTGSQKSKVAEKYHVLDVANPLCEVELTPMFANNGYVVFIGRVTGKNVQILGELSMTQARLDEEVARIDELHFQPAAN